MNEPTSASLLNASPQDEGVATDDALFENILTARLSRRALLKGSFSVAATAFFGIGLSACQGRAGDVSTALSPAIATRRLKLNFDAVAKSLADTVNVPADYTVKVLYRLGDPLAADIADYRNDGSESGTSFALRAGDHHDGMHFFGIGANDRFDPTSSDRGLLVLNHEAITPAYLHKNGITIDHIKFNKYPSTITASMARTLADEVIKEMHAHGVSVIEVHKRGTTYAYRQDSALNRRITTFTEMDLSGPAARTPYMITAYSTNGAETRGTVANCANGYTPWGTYLTCEENWAAYFRRIASEDDPKRSPKERTSFSRYGVAGSGRELWATATAIDAGDTSFSRWNAMYIGTSADGSDDFRNIANTFGWVVEIDPFRPLSRPKKRTALGRFAHEGAWPGPVIPGKPLVWYMGCDARNEYIYKYISAAVWDPADANMGVAAGDKYLDDGKLYAAKFNADGSGQWIELRFGMNGLDADNTAYAFADQADVLINARLAADAVGATKMDRPEWGAVNPANGEVYMTLTNNRASTRPLTATDAANPRFYHDPKGGSAQKGNPNGHIIRWAENNREVAATGFKWDVFLFGARSTADANRINLSGLTADNDFSSPDGLWFSQRTGLLWIQTDDSAYTDVSNCMLLAAVVGQAGDGAKKTIVNVDGTATKAVDTYVGATLGDANLRRFLTGPKECEITGLAETPDGKALFVNIQHPGEDTPPDFANPVSFGSHWPDGGNARPRSATIVITKNDGGTIGGGFSMATA